MSAKAVANPRGASFKERWNAFSCYTSLQPNRGKPHFSTHISRRSGSPGVFSDPQYVAEAVPSSHNKCSAVRRADSFHRCGSAQVLTVNRKEDPPKRQEEKKKPPESIHKHPFRSTSPSPGIPPARDMFVRSQNTSRGYSRNASSSRAEDDSAKDENGEEINDSKTVPASLARLIPADLTGKAARSQQKKDEQEKRRVTEALSVRYDYVAHDADRIAADKRVDKKGNYLFDVTKQQTQRSETPEGMRRVEQYGLRYEHFRPTRIPPSRQNSADASPNASPISSREQRPAPQPEKESPKATMNWERVLEFCSDDALQKCCLVNKSMHDRTTELLQRREAERHPEKALWEKLSRAEEALKTIPTSFFEALRTLKTEPPKKVMFVLQLVYSLLQLSEEAWGASIPNYEENVISLSLPNVWTIVQHDLRQRAEVGSLDDLVSRFLQVGLHEAPPQHINAMKTTIDSYHTIFCSGSPHHDFDEQAEEITSVLKMQNHHIGILFAWVQYFVRVFLATM